MWHTTFILDATHYIHKSFKILYLFFIQHTPFNIDSTYNIHDIQEYATFLLHRIYYFHTWLNILHSYLTQHTTSSPYKTMRHSLHTWLYILYLLCTLAYFDTLHSHDSIYYTWLYILYMTIYTISTLHTHILRYTTFTACCLWSAIPCQSPISISWVSFPRNVAKET